jgi:hypothetical protein
MVVTANTSNTTCIYRYFGICCVGQSVWYPVRYVLRPIELAYRTSHRLCFLSRGPTLSKGRRICRDGHTATVRNATVYSSSSWTSQIPGPPPVLPFLVLSRCVIPRRATAKNNIHSLHTYKGIGDRLFPPWNFSRFYVVGPIEHLPNFIRSSFEIRGESTAR